MKPRNKADAYTYRVFWSPEDEEFVAVTAEFGDGLSWLAPSADEAFVGIRRLVARTIKELASAGEPVPEPLSAKRFSGKFVVRVPPELHRQLATQAAEAGVSLNRLIAHRLSTATTARRPRSR